jgi:hypothetical protein
MQTQRDHVHAHQFQMARMSSALMLGDPSMAENPMRRTSLGLVAGVVISLLAVVAFGVYGWIVPGGKTSWRKAGAIIVEKETGTRYVFLNGTLYPTLNMASAMIITGGTSAKVELVSRNSRGWSVWAARSARPRPARSGSTSTRRRRPPS